VGEAEMSRRERRGQQFRLDVRLYIVRADGWEEVRVQAKTAAAAKYQVFKLAREAGYYRDPRSGFRDFLERGWSARELRR
jgi:hypothetical protein